MDQPRAILNFQREGHCDEADRILRLPSAGDYIRRQAHEVTAGRHLAGRIGALSMQGDFTPNSVLDQVMREYDWLLNGNALPVPGGVS